MISVLTAHISGREEYLQQAYRSLLNQDTDWEWVVISDPDCREVDFNDSRVITIKTAVPLSISEKRNCALLRARGQYIATLDDDDLLPRGSLARRREPLDTGAVQFSFGIHAYISGPERPTPYSPGPVAGQKIIAEWQRRKAAGNRSVAPTPAGVLWRREIIWRLGGWPALPRSADTALLLRAAAEYQGYFIPEVTYLIRAHPGRSSKNDYDPENWAWIEQWRQHCSNDTRH